MRIYFNTIFHIGAHQRAGTSRKVIDSHNKSPQHLNKRTRIRSTIDVKVLLLLQSGDWHYAACLVLATTIRIPVCDAVCNCDTVARTNDSRTPLTPSSDGSAGSTHRMECILMYSHCFTQASDNYYYMHKYLNTIPTARTRTECVTGAGADLVRDLFARACIYMMACWPNPRTRC